MAVLARKIKSYCGGGREGGREMLLVFFAEESLGLSFE